MALMLEYACAKRSCLTILQEITDINELSFCLLLLLRNAHVFISYTDNCDCSTWEIKNINRRVYASIVYTNSFRRTYIRVHSTQRVKEPIWRNLCTEFDICFLLHHDFSTYCQRYCRFEGSSTTLCFLAFASLRTIFVSVTRDKMTNPGRDKKYVTRI